MDGDGNDDLAVQCEDEDGAFFEGDTTATLTGQLTDGPPPTLITGTDSICIAPGQGLTPVPSPGAERSGAGPLRARPEPQRDSRDNASLGPRVSA